MDRGLRPFTAFMLAIILSRLSSKAPGIRSTLESVVLSKRRVSASCRYRKLLGFFSTKIKLDSRFMGLLRSASIAIFAVRTALIKINGEPS